MRLYPRAGQVAVAHEGQRYKPGPDGGFDLPEEAGRFLHSFHSGGKPLWETDIERQHRLIAEEAERRKDPATLLSAVEQLVSAAKAPAAAAPAPEPEAPKSIPKAAPAKAADGK